MLVNQHLILGTMHFHFTDYWSGCNNKGLLEPRTDEQVPWLGLFLLCSAQHEDPGYLVFMMTDSIIQVNTQPCFKPSSGSVSSIHWSPLPNRAWVLFKDQLPHKALLLPRKAVITCSHILGRCAISVLTSEYKYCLWPPVQSPLQTPSSLKASILSNSYLCS